VLLLKTGLAVNKTKKLLLFFFFRAMGANLRQIEKEEVKKKGRKKQRNG